MPAFRLSRFDQVILRGEIEYSRHFLVLISEHIPLQAVNVDHALMQFHVIESIKGAHGRLGYLQGFLLERVQLLKFVALLHAFVDHDLVQSLLVE